MRYEGIPWTTNNREQVKVGARDVGLGLLEASGCTARNRDEPLSHCPSTLLCPNLINQNRCFLSNMIDRFKLLGREKSTDTGKVGDTKAGTKWAID